MKLALCLPGDSFTGGFIDSFAATIPQLNDALEGVILSRAYSSDVAQARLRVLGVGADGGKPFNGAAYDAMLWIDSDIVWTWDDLRTMIETFCARPSISILSGLYPMRPGGPFAAFRDFSGALGGGALTADAAELRSAKPFPVAFSGMGFMMLRHGVIESMEYPYFTRAVHVDAQGVRQLMSEDAGFCYSAAREGHTVYAHPLVRLSHEKRLRF